MIVTVTPNPSIDRTIGVDTLRPGEVNRATGTRIDPGGKGVNVARALTAHRTPAVAVFPPGGAEGRVMTDLLDAAGVAHHGVPVAGTLRMNLAVVDADGTTTKVNEPGPELTSAEIAGLLGAAEAYATPGGWVVGCGALPPGAPATLYAELVSRSRAGGAKVAIDSSGPALAAAIGAGPDLIKPNLEELQELVGSRLPSIPDIVAAARGLVERGVGIVVISLGADGAILVDHTDVVHASASIQTPRSTVGAGDCLLAGVLHVLSAGGGTRDALETGVRWGAAAVALPGSRVPSPADVALASLDAHRSLA